MQGEEGKVKGEGDRRKDGEEGREEGGKGIRLVGMGKTEEKMWYATYADGLAGKREGRGDGSREYSTLERELLLQYEREAFTQRPREKLLVMR